MQVAEVIIDRVDLLERIRKSEAKDDEVVKAVEEMKRAGVKMLRDKEWREEDGLMLRERKVYVSKDKKLRVEVIWLHHDTLVGGHGGQWKITELVARSNERSQKVCGRMRCMPKKQKPNRGTCRKTHAKRSTSQTLDPYFSGLYYEAATS